MIWTAGPPNSREVVAGSGAAPRPRRQNAKATPNCKPISPASSLPSKKQTCPPPCRYKQPCNKPCLPPGPPTQNSPNFKKTSQAFTSPPTNDHENVTYFFHAVLTHRSGCPEKTTGNIIFQPGLFFLFRTSIPSHRPLPRRPCRRRIRRKP